MTALETKVDQGVVDIVSTLGDENAESAGTGIVLTSTGEVLTNNHVVDGATDIKVTDVANGKTYSATVVGYDASADIAVLRLQDASGLKTATLGDSSKVAAGDAVVAVGNAGGAGGTPSAATGTVTAVGQSITASDQSTGTSEQLSGLIESNADLQPGDSGGPLVDTTGRVIAMDTAASSGFQLQTNSSQSYAIPIDEALSIAAQIEGQHASSTVHIGPTAFLGVGLSAATDYRSDGVTVVGVLSGSPVADAGITAGDLITSLGGHTVDSASSLAAIVGQDQPGQSVSISWIDQYGETHTATIVLATGPAA